MKKTAVCIFIFLLSSNLLASPERVRTLRCNKSKAEGIIQLLNYIDIHWAQVEDLWISEGALKDPKCLKRRFRRNGVVMCHESQRVVSESALCESRNGWANFLGIRANICSDFMQTVDNMEFHNKRACYTALIFKLYGDTCYKRSRFPGRYMNLKDFGFKWYSARNPVTINYRDCNFSI